MRYFEYRGKKARLAVSFALLLSAWGLAAAQSWENEVYISVRDGYRYVESNGIPDHAYGRFPNRHNPNAVAPQKHSFRVPLEPQPAARPTPLGLHPFGVALNGVPFDPAAAEFWRGDPRSGWTYAALTGKTDLGMDENSAHVQPGGAYHYHGYPTGLIEGLERRAGMVLVGYAADGFPIYGPLGYSDPRDATSDTRRMRSSYRLKKGERPSGPGGSFDGTFVEDFEYVANSGDLDECNGRVGVTPEYPDGIYHYFITIEFPFVPRFFRGIPDASFQRQGPPPGRRPPPRGPPPPERRPPPRR